MASDRAVKTPREIARPVKLNFPPASAGLRVEWVLWEFAKFYARMHVRDYPDLEMSEHERAFLSLLCLEQLEYGVRHTDPDGTITLKATPKCPGRDQCDDKSFVIISRTQLH
jgi:hypothetical protein